MTSLTDDAGEAFGNVLSQWADAENYKYYGRVHRTRYVPQGPPDAPTKADVKTSGHDAFFPPHRFVGYFSHRAPQLVSSFGGAIRQDVVGDGKLTLPSGAKWSGLSEDGV
ncbi:unnamed protein product [Protopolystoma xenopodis]|uniref:Uncharacterized protein n=1 Tax=Protopolystoma xenopodis TaxID=117903 RepID=A0A3S5FFM3_9PLAT|nr:unnamed protein product [Protopolystoma xenopodis]